MSRKKTHPEVALQVISCWVSAGQLLVAELLQSPQLLVTTVPLPSTMVAHQATGLSAKVHW